MDDDEWQEMPVVHDGRSRGGASASSSSTSYRSSAAHAGYSRSASHLRTTSSTTSGNHRDSDEDEEEGPEVEDGASYGHSDQAGPSSYTGAFDSAYADSGGRRPVTGVAHSSSHQSASLSASGSGGPSGYSRSTTTNATGRSMGLKDARGYDWRSKPAGAPGMHHSRKDEAGGGGDPSLFDAEDEEDSEDDDEKGQGYTQLRLDEDEEADQLHAATEYLFGGAAGMQKTSSEPIESSVGYSYQNESSATPLSQMMTTKNLLSEPQKIAYVGLCALKAKEMVRNLKRVPGAAKELAESIKSIEEWEVKVMARLFQHMDIDQSEQTMIKSLGEHGVLPSDLAVSLVTTQKVENPDYDPLAAQEKEEQERAEKERADGQAETEKVTASSAGPFDEGAAQSQGTGQAIASEEASVATAEASHGPEGGGDEAEGDLGSTVSDLPKKSSGVEVIRQPPQMQHGTDDTGDIGVDQRETRTPVAQPASLPEVQETVDQRGTPKAEGVQLPTEEGPIRADPNSAAQAAAAEANMTATAGTQNHFGLTAEPQTVEPPPSALPGVTTELSTSDTHITLDLRWTILCDLFLVLTADSVYDARSRVLLERVAEQLELTWMDVTKFEKRVTDALEIEEGIEKLRDRSVIAKRDQEAIKKKWAMVGLATVGGGLVIGLSAGLAAPLVGAGLAGFLGTVGIGGTSSFLAGVGGAALITTTGTVSGAAIAGKGMTKRIQSVKTFLFKPIHNNKRINCIVAVPGFMNGEQDDVRLPFSVIDSVMGDVFSVLWEPEMMREMGNAIYILWNETLVMGVQQVLAATVAGAFLGALVWPLWLTKLGYLIDNPWSNALTRAEAAGRILADVLAKRQLGVRPITLVGFSLGARAIFFALRELHKKKAFGVVQNVYVFGTPVSATDKVWREARSVVSGRFVNGFSRTDWILGYLHRASSGGLRSIAGLHPIERVPEIENVDVTTSVPGHLQYRAFMPLVMSEVGFRVTQDWFDEPEDLNKIPEREVGVDETDPQDRIETKFVKTSTGGFGRIFRGESSDGSNTPVSGAASLDLSRAGTPAPQVATTVHGGVVAPPRAQGPQAPPDYDYDDDDADDLPSREGSSEPESPTKAQTESEDVMPKPPASSDAEPPSTPEAEKPPSQSAHVDTDAILAELRSSGIEVKELQSSMPALSLAKSGTPTASTLTSEAPPETISKPLPKKVAELNTTVPTPPAPKSPGLFSAFFSRKRAPSSDSIGRQQAASAPRPATPTAASSSGRASPVTGAAPTMPQVDAPALSMPGGAYSSGRIPSVSASKLALATGQAPARSTSYNLSATASDDKTPEGMASDWDAPSVSSSSAATTPSATTQHISSPWARPYASTAADSALPMHPPSYAPPSSVNLSFASDFDDDDAGDSGGFVASTTQQPTGSIGANAYGLSAEAARDLARQFGGMGMSSPSIDPSSASASASVSTPSASRGVVNPFESVASHGWGDEEGTTSTNADPNNEGFSQSRSDSPALSTLQPLQTSYMSAGRWRIDGSEEDSGTLAGQSGLTRSHGNGKNTNAADGRSSTTGLSMGIGGGMGMGLEGDNPWS